MYSYARVLASHAPRALMAVALLAAACADAPKSTTAVKAPALAISSGGLKDALIAARNTANGGFNLDMWGTIVDRTGTVIAVAYTGTTVDAQWPGSRDISAQKANTANDFSLAGLALSTANLYSATQPGGSLFGLQFSNPIDPNAAYCGKTSDYGTDKDCMIGKKIGGINVFGGGLPLYDSNHNLVGGLGVSGDASCADHNIAWKVRHALGLDYVPAGVADGGADDNIIYDITNGVSASGFGHPTCSAAATAIGQSLPTQYPISH